MQFQAQGFSIESGMAVDARIVRSASKPVSGKKLEQLKTERRQEEQDATIPPAKFRRDIESDWTVKNDKPYFGMKEHAAVDVKSGLVLSSLTSKASENDSPYLPAVVVKGIHGSKLPDIVYVDKGYPGEPNRVFLSMNGIRDGIMCKDEVHAKLTATEIKRNKRIAKVRYIVEQYFGVSALQEGGGPSPLCVACQGGLEPTPRCHRLQYQKLVLSDRTVLLGWGGGATRAGKGRAGG